MLVRFGILYLFLSFIFYSQTACQQAVSSNPPLDGLKAPELVVLGTIQDAGSPHIACKKDCCKKLFKTPDYSRKVVSLGLVDFENKQTWLLEATPDIPEQMKLLKEFAPFNNTETPSGIFLTHAHIGHYSGLMYLGREAMSSKSLPVYVMPKMARFLENNGPWKQLIDLNNILIKPLQDNLEVKLSDKLTIKPILVPHRDEYSETVGYIITGPNKKALFIPDIDKWSKWSKSIISEVKQVDYAFIDATFYDAEELNNRDMSEIPHPFVVETMQLFKDEPAAEKSKIYFIHLNHTNPLLNPNSKQAKALLKAGFNIAKFKQRVAL
jgi:pyrroloquinoline quinone biosynthesis protein B